MKQSKKCDFVAVFGTSAELIKIWPVVSALSERSQVSLLSTNQQPDEIAELADRLEIRGIQNLRSIKRGNLVSKLSVIPWALTTGSRLFLRLIGTRRGSRKSGRTVMVLVHGDTMTCLVGAFIGRLSGCRVAHIEAGLRSRDWRNPFPEEINRILTAYLAHFHFCPDEVAVKNLQDRAGVIVNTNGNTSRDSMRRIQKMMKPELNSEQFTLVSLHRAELLADEEVLRSSIVEVVEASRRHKVIMVLDALTENTLRHHDLLDLIRSSPIDLRRKMPYPDFLKLVVQAERVVTDSGGLQEECGFLSIPCLVHRRATERFDGIGTTAELSMWENGAITRFLEQPLQGLAQARTLDGGSSPTDRIVETFLKFGVM